MREEPVGFLGCCIAGNDVAQGCGVDHHAVDQAVDGVADFGVHLVGEERLGQYVGVEQFVAHSVADGGGNAWFFFGDDAGGERHMETANVYGPVGTEQHPDGHFVG